MIIVIYRILKISTESKSVELLKTRTGIKIFAYFYTWAWAVGADFIVYRITKAMVSVPFWKRVCAFTIPFLYPHTTSDRTRSPARPVSPTSMNLKNATFIIIS